MSPPVLVNVMSGTKTSTDKVECDAERKSDSEDADDTEYECTSDDSMSQGEISNFVCDLCSISFETKNNLQKHLMRHSQTKPLRISRCLQKANNEKCLVNETEGSKSPSLACLICGVKFENESLLKQHSVTEHKEDTTKTDVPAPLKCNICERTFKTKRGQQRHRCRDLVKPSFVCDHCGQMFRSKSILNEHVNIHTRKKAFVCDVCNRIFAHRSTLRQHRHYAHMSEKQHKCEVCGKYLAHSAALKQHARLHTGELPYECDRCPRKFNTIANLRTHYYVHTGEYPFSCDICKKGYRQKYRLIAHYEIHSDPAKESAYMEKLWRDRETVCDVCGKEFSKPYNLKMHYRTHTGERPYKCEECGMSFIQKPHLKSHSYTHTQEYPFICFVCDKGFRDCSELSSHLQKLHPEHSTL